MAVKGIDVSSHQGLITEKDWKKVKAAGYDFVWIKVNEGNLLDATAERNAFGARAAGLLVGGYDFVRPGGGGRGTLGQLEWDIFKLRAKKIGLLKRGCLRPAIDVEALTKAGKLPIPAPDVRLYVKRWISECFRDLGKHPEVYTGSWYWDDLMHEKRRHGCKLWLAAYVPPSQVKQHIPDAWGGHKSFWQHSDKGFVPGIDGPVDLNVYGSSMRNLKRTHTL